MIRIIDYKSIDRSEILDRKENVFNVADAVSEIIRTVREKGDAALFEYCERFDKVKLSSLEVTQTEIEEAFALVEPDFVEILKEAKENIYAFHSRQVRNSFLINDKDGVVIGQKVIPIEKVGLYVPVGTAAYPSSVLIESPRIEKYLFLYLFFTVIPVLRFTLNFLQNNYITLL